MGKDKFCIFIICLFIALLILTASAYANGDLDNYQAPPNNPGIGLGKYSGSGILFFGDFKTCSTDAFFYFILVNNSAEDITAVLPRRVFIDGRYYYVDTTAYKYKALSAGWGGQQFADARKGSSLVLGNNMSMIVPSQTAYSIMGRVTGISHELSRFKDTGERDDTITADLDVYLDNNLMKASGYFTEEGSICDSIQIVPFSGDNFIEGSYVIDPSGKKSCSLGFYYRVENMDSRYSTVVELPRWVEINNYRWDVGCRYIYDNCLISGFRHYSYGLYPSDGDYKKSDFVFCDQDRSKGNYCYEENGLWWLIVPPGTSYAIRGMINDLCSDEEGHANPLTQDYIDLRFFVSDSGSEKWWADGTIFGSEGDAATENAKNYSFISRIEDRDPDLYQIQEDIEKVLEIQKNRKNQPVSKSSPVELKSANQQPAAASDVNFFVLPGFWNTDRTERTMDHFPATGFPMALTESTSQELLEAPYQDLGAYVLSVPSQGISSRIVQIPADPESGTWQVSQLGDQAGLLEGSFLPGEGVSVIAAHKYLDTAATGPFAALSAMLVDDRIFITTPQGTMLQYRVYENDLFNAEAFDEVGLRVRKGALVLITCENELAAGGYQDRRVVFAEPV